MVLELGYLAVDYILHLITKKFGQNTWFGKYPLSPYNHKVVMSDEPERSNPGSNFF